MPTAVFDMLGTFFSLEPLRQRLSALGAPECALDAWFSEATRDAIAISQSGAWVPFTEILSAALPRTLAELGRGSQERSRQELVLKGLNVLNPMDGAQAGSLRLANAGWKLVALTNTSEAHARALLDRAGLLDRFEAVISADKVQAAKPHPDVYALARAAGGRDCWMVTAHAWDAVGAQRAGMRTIWVSKKEKRWLDALPRPDLEMPDFATATDALLRVTGAGASSNVEHGAQA